eukprot:scaffold4569_cov117-Isochrysis_galbana.AAC.1
MDLRAIRCIQMAIFKRTKKPGLPRSISYYDSKGFVVLYGPHQGECPSVTGSGSRNRARVRHAALAHPPTGRQLGSPKRFGCRPPDLAQSRRLWR